MQARYCGGNRCRGKWKSRDVHFVTSRRCRCCIVIPPMPRAQKLRGRRGGGRLGARGVSRNCCTRYTSRRYLVRLLARQFVLLYYKEHRSVVCKSVMREATSTLRNRRARLSTLTELRQLDKTAASEASRLVRINADGIVVLYVHLDSRVYLRCLQNVTRYTWCAIESVK